MKIPVSQSLIRIEEKAQVQQDAVHFADPQLFKDHREIMVGRLVDRNGTCRGTEVLVANFKCLRIPVNSDQPSIGRKLIQDLCGVPPRPHRTHRGKYHWAGGSSNCRTSETITGI